MCLTRILKEKPEKEGWGYKLFDRYNYNGKPQLWFQYYSLPWGQHVPRNRWLKAVRTRVHYNFSFTPTGPKRYYTSGFHIYKTAPAGLRYDMRYGRLVKVKYRGGRILGVQDGRSVIIADEIFIPYDPKPKVPKPTTKRKKGTK